MDLYIHPCLGMRHTKEAKEKMRQKKLGRKYSDKYKLELTLKQLQAPVPECGVFPMSSRRWRVNCSVGNKTLYLGSYDSKYVGQLAYINFKLMRIAQLEKQLKQMKG